MEKVTFGAGCFWCIEAIYQDLTGVESVVSGFAGGHVKNPAYKEVVNGTTGHAEVIQMVFDPDIISFRDLTEIFFTVHDPTTVDRQGNDVGPQYRSIILYHSEEQRDLAAKVKYEFEERKLWKNPIVTEIEPFDGFFEAEKYHQNYYKNNKDQSYCKFVIEPKVNKFRKQFLNKLKN